MSTTDDHQDPHAVTGQVNRECDGYVLWLDDYVDDELTSARRLELEKHLATCAECRQDIEGLREVLLAVSDLPAERLPARDLWGDIAPRLESRSRPTLEEPLDVEPSVSKQGPRWWSQAIAAGLFTLLGFSAAQWLPSLRQGPEVKPTLLVDAAAFPDAAAAGRPAESVGETILPVASRSVEFVVAETEFLRAKESLLMSVLARREELSPATMELLQRNLQIIDQATRDLRAALREDPANPRLEGRVLDNYRRELSLLKRLSAFDA